MIVILVAGLGSWVGCKKESTDEFSRLTNLGRTYYEKGEAEKAIPPFERAVQINPTHPDARLNLANAYLLANQPLKTIEQAQAVIDSDHNSTAGYYLLGCAYLRLNKPEEAIKALQQAKILDPTLAAITFQLGVAQQDVNHVDEAVAEFQETVALDPDHPAAWYRLSQLLLRSGKQEESAQALERHRQIAAKAPNQLTTPATYERSKYTQIRTPFKLEQPDPKGIQVAFSDATAEAIPGAVNYRGPMGIIDLRHDGQNSLFLLESNQNFCLLVNSNGAFQPRASRLPASPDGKYRRCLVGELHTDQFEDVIVLGENASHVFKFVTNAGITEVTRFAGLKDLKASDGALVDLDFTGKLNLLTIQPGGNSARTFLNRGNFYFSENTATSGFPASLQGARQLIVDDWNDDDLNDVLLARKGNPPMLLLKERGGPLTVTNTPAEWPGADVIATGDLNNDLKLDLVSAGPTQLEIIYPKTGEHRQIPLGGFAVTSLKLVDYDNDGWLDICAIGKGIRIWRNLGQGGFQEVTHDLGLDKFSNLTIDSLAAADFDNDGDTDLILSSPERGLVFLRNNGGNLNHQFKLRLIGHRSNPSGLGVRIELTSGGLRTLRSVSQLPIEIGIGRNSQVDSLTVRWFDLAVNTTDIKVEPGKLLTMDELTLPSGSCPYLYAWDGSRFRFVTDLLGAAPAGLPVSETRMVDADPFEIVQIGNERTFAPLGNDYVLQVTEELREVLYLDEAKLLVADHAPGTEVYSTSKLLPGKPFLRPELVTLGNQHPLLKAVNDAGTDVTPSIKEIDQIYFSPAKLRPSQTRGLAEPFSVTLDFGALDPARPLVLALTGWLRFGGGMANVGASHNPDLPFPFPKIEVEAGAGGWKPIDVVVGAPAGKTKTILVDLAGKLPPEAKRLRLSTAFEIHWDRAALFEKIENPSTRITTVSPASANLHWRGFSDFEPLPWYRPLTPRYESVHADPNWRITPSGWCTRYGDVGELIAGTDNALALLNGGDELTLRFPVGAVPTRTPNSRRTFFLYAVGWDKDADFHCARGNTVEPIPWHGMDDQNYGRETRPAFSNDAWLGKYNTRWVGPYTLARRPH